MDVTEANGVESGESRKLRFQSLNSALVAFATRCEDWERRMWQVVGKWLDIDSSRVEISWPKDYAIADLASEIESAAAIRDLGAPVEFNRAMLKSIASLALRDTDQATLEAVLQAIDTQAQERPPEPTDDQDNIDGQ
jgi:hypothetical protein